MSRPNATAIALAASLTVGALVAGASSASAQQCTNKAGEGTGANKDSAMFQAY
jgi:hypothetical protein